MRAARTLCQKKRSLEAKYVKWKEEKISIDETRRHKIQVVDLVADPLLSILKTNKQYSFKMVATAGDNQCEVVLVGCGVPKRGMGVSV